MEYLLRYTFSINNTFNVKTIIDINQNSRVSETRRSALITFYYAHHYVDSNIFLIFEVKYYRTVGISFVFSSG